jgi:hypothetical protein
MQSASVEGCDVRVKPQVLCAVRRRPNTAVYKRNPPPSDTVETASSDARVRLFSRSLRVEMLMADAPFPHRSTRLSVNPCVSTIIAFYSALRRGRPVARVRWKATGMDRRGSQMVGWCGIGPNRLPRDFSDLANAERPEAAVGVPDDRQS